MYTNKPSGTSKNLLRGPLSRLRCSRYPSSAALLNTTSAPLATVFRGAPSSAQLRRGIAGLTLVELLMFIVVISIAVLALLRVYALTVKNSPDPQLRKQALSLAEGLLEEVQLARFTFCDPMLDPLAYDPVARPNATACTVPEVVGQEAGSVVRPYDNVNDYVNQFGTATAAFNNGSQLVDAAGNAFNLPGYSASLLINPEPLNGILSSSASASTMEVLRISVTVTYNNGADSITLDGYRTRYAPYATP